MNLLHVTIFFIWQALATSYLLPNTRPPRVTKFVLPEAVQIQGHKIMPELRIPNEDFCRKMLAQPFRQYMILPWWYVHCEKILENDEKLYRANKLPPIYAKILKMVQKYKKKQALLDAIQRTNY